MLSISNEKAKHFSHAHKKTRNLRKAAKNVKHLIQNKQYIFQNRNKELRAITIKSRKTIHPVVFQGKNLDNLLINGAEFGPQFPRNDENFEEEPRRSFTYRIVETKLEN